MTPAIPSIRARLLHLQWLALVLTGLCGALASFVVAWQQVNDWRNHLMEQVAHTVVRHGMDGAPDTEASLTDNGQFTSQIWTTDGQLHYSPSTRPGPPRQQPGRHRVEWDFQVWDVFTLQQDGLTIQVSQGGEARNEALLRTALGLGGGLAVLTWALYGLLILATSRSLRPLDELRDALQRSNPLGSTPDWAQHNWPQELRPLVQTLATQFDRAAQAHTAQKHLIDRAAHEFRTPLSALRLHAQLLGRSGQADVNERHRIHVLQATDRLARLVDQLLRLAEYDAMEPTPEPQAFAVAPWLSPPLQLWSSLALAQGVRLSTQVPQGAQLRGHPAALQAMLDNVVHNALRHSPAGAEVALSLQLQDGHATWRVQDHGPGMSAAQLARVGQRFAGDDHASAQGSGLGLAIAARVLALHSGELTAQPTPGGGLTVLMRWPQSAGHTNS